MSHLSDLLPIARSTKHAVCLSQPMSDLVPVLHVVTHDGRIHPRIFEHADALKDVGALAESVRATLDCDPAWAAVLVESYTQRGDARTLPGLTLAEDYDQNPATAVLPALSIIGCSSQGAWSAALLPYRYDDHGGPVWEQPMISETAGQLMTEGLGSVLGTLVAQVVAP